jgi:hypothetical protein
LSMKYEIRKAGLQAKAKITKVNIRQAKEIFKNSTAPDQTLIEICANIDGWEGRIGTIPKPVSKYVSPKSKMAMFLQRYKKTPQAGITVDVSTNERGYWTLAL